MFSFDKIGATPWENRGRKRGQEWDPEDDVSSHGRGSDLEGKVHHRGRRQDRGFGERARKTFGKIFYRNI